MKVGIHLPQWGSDANRIGVLDAARLIEEAGLDSVWVGDHLVHPNRQSRPYPYASEAPFKPDDGFLEALTVLAAACAVTQRVSLATSVMVMAMREPLLTAKVVATLDVLSGGRTLLALGVGWWPEEIEALGHAFPGRGRRLDEQIDAMRMLWRDGSGSFDGDHVRFEHLTSKPLPIQAGGPRLLIGGTSDVALRRVVTHGDGWHALGVHDATLREGRAKIDALAETAGRDPRTIGMSTSTVLPDDRDTTLRRLSRLHQAGVDHCVFDVRDRLDGGLQRAVDQLALDVLPALASEFPPDDTRHPDAVTGKEI